MTMLIISTGTLQLWADQADVLYRQGLELEKKGQGDFAIFKYSTIIRNYPDSKWADAALFKIGEFYYENRDYFNARENFEKLIRQYPKSSYAGPGRQYLENIARTSQKIDLESAMEKVLNNIEELKNEQRWDEMLSECDKLSSFEHIPEEYQAKLVEYCKLCGNALIKNESWDKAKVAYEKVMRIAPEDTEALNRLYEINKIMKAPTK